MFNERDCHIWRRILTARGLFCSAQSGAILRFDARGNHDERDGGIRNCGRRRIADLLRADDAIAAPARRSPMVWRQFRVRRRQSIMPAATAGASSTGSAATIPHPIVRQSERRRWGRRWRWRKRLTLHGRGQGPAYRNRGFWIRLVCIKDQCCLCTHIGRMADHDGKPHPVSCSDTLQSNLPVSGEALRLSRLRRSAARSITAYIWRHHITNG